MVDKGTAIDVFISTGPSKSVKYFGSVAININPFDYIDADEAEISLDMEQDGYTSTIFEPTTMSSDNSQFPRTIDGIDGGSANPGTVKMYINGEVFKNPNDQSKDMVWTAKFEAVED
jgi:hypothetical protein